MGNTWLFTYHKKKECLKLETNIKFFENKQKCHARIITFQDKGSILTLIDSHNSLIWEKQFKSERGALCSLKSNFITAEEINFFDMKKVRVRGNVKWISTLACPLF